MSLGKAKILSQGASGGADGSANFTITTYSGGSAGQVVDVGFQPDLIIGKRRDATEHWWVNDSTRSGKSLFLNLNNAQISFQYTTPNSNGFVVNATGGVHNTGNLVTYCWRAPTSETNNAGDVTGTIKKNVDAGFSIVNYTATSGQTVGHGLGGTPDLIIKKALTTDDWLIYSSVAGTGKYQSFTRNEQGGGAGTDGFVTRSNSFPTVNSTVFSDNWTSGTVNYIAYCFKNVAGYQKIGSYEGNANATGPIVLTGFRPRFLMIKNGDSSEGGGAAWLIYDSVRSTSNPRDKRLYASENYQEASNANYYLDFNDDGFQIKAYSFNYGFNNSGQTYIYLAIA